MMVPSYSLSIGHVTFNLSRIYLSVLNVNFSHACISYAEIFEKTSSGGLEVSFSIC